ncbi:MAG: S8 family serine peptidase [Gemmatimonadetes bacterium]|nr:S8 family serine peptidase [Gemmatimonadota bacterium]
MTNCLRAIQRRSRAVTAVTAGAAALLFLYALPLSAQDPRPHPLRALLASQPSGTLALWVYFDSAAWAGGSVAVLDPAARARRAIVGVGILPNDTHSPEGLARAIAATGARIRHESRWLRALSVEADSAAASRLAVVRGVRRIVPVARLALPLPLEPGPLRAPGAAPADSVYGPIFDFLDKLGVPLAHRLGFDGTGIRVGILDTGFFPRHEALRGLHVLAARDLIQNDSVVSDEPGETPGAQRHGTAVWSLIGGRAPGQLVAPAFGASFALAKTELVDREPKADEDRWVAGIEWLEALGVRVVNSSLGYRTFDDFAYPFAALNGDSAASTKAADEAARRGVLLVTAMGNGGPESGSLGAPADADSVIAVGAVAADGSVTNFSSRGPTADGRAKPELVAFGVGVPIASGDDVRAYGVGSGTSFAVPLVAGLAALFGDAHPDRGPMAVRAALLASADRARSPDNEVGHGLPNVASAILFPDGLRGLPLTEKDGAGLLTTLVPRFRWEAPMVHPLARPIVFHLELGADSTFAGAALPGGDSVVDAFAVRPGRPLPARATLFWRVRASTAPGVVRTSAPLGPIRVPPWIRLMVLNDPRGTTIQESRPALTWESFDVPPPAGPLVFELQILSDRGPQPVQRYANLTARAFTVPEPLALNTPFGWRIIARAPGGGADTATSAGPFVITSRARPPVTILHQNFPNPFPRSDLNRTDTSIWFDLHRPGTVELAIYDLRGRLVRRLIPKPGCGPVQLDAGLYGREESDNPCIALRWNGRDDRGETVEPGVYIVRLRAPETEETRRIVFWP